MEKAFRVKHKAIGFVLIVIFTGALSAQHYQYDQAKVDAAMKVIRQQQAQAVTFRNDASLEAFAKMSDEDQRTYLRSFLAAPDINFYFNGADGKPLSLERQNQIFAARLQSMSSEEKSDVYLEMLKSNLDMNPNETPYRPIVIDGITFETYGKLNEFLIKKSELNSPVRQQKFLCEAVETNFGKAIDGRESNFSPEFVKPEQNRIANMEKHLKSFGSHNDQCILDRHGVVQYFSISQSLLFVKTELTQYVNLQRSKPQPGKASVQQDSETLRQPACTRKEIEEYITKYTDYINQNKSTHNFGFLVFEGRCRITAKLRLIDKKWYLQDLIAPSKTQTDNLIPFSNKQELINLLVAKQADPKKAAPAVLPIPPGVAPAHEPLGKPSAVPAAR